MTSSASFGERSSPSSASAEAFSDDIQYLTHSIVKRTFTRFQTQQLDETAKSNIDKRLNDVVEFHKQRLGYFVAGGVSAAVSCSLFNPLDCLRVRWQVAPKSSDPTKIARGPFRYGLDIIRTEGLVEGLWKPGLGANVAGMVCSAAIRFGYYETVRDGLGQLLNDSSGMEWNSNDEMKNKDPTTMLLSGLICGTAAYFVTTPFHLLKTMIQAEKGKMNPTGREIITGRQMHVTGFVTGASKIARERGLLSLYTGCVPLASRGALFTAGQMLGYDGLKTFAKTKGVEDSPFLHLVCSIAASFGASAMSAPADLVMAKFMTGSSTNSELRLTDCIRQIYLENGIMGFWRGWALSFVRLTPVMLTFSTVYEQVRFHFGLGYLS